MLSLLQMSKEKIQNVEEPSQGPLEHFGKLVTTQTRWKHKSQHDVHMKSTTDVLFSNYAVDLEVDEQYNCIVCCYFFAVFLLMSVRRGRGSHLDFEIWQFPIKRLVKKGCFLSFEWVKWNFTTFGHPWKNPFAAHVSTYFYSMFFYCFLCLFLFRI